MVRENVNIVSHAVTQIERISSVVEENVQISHDTKESFFQYGGYYW